MCYVSVGHVARIFEAARIATTTIVIEAFSHYAADMNLPRTLLTGHPMGRPLGPPGDAATQTAVLRAALDLVDTAEEGGAVARFDAPYRPGRS